MDDLAISQFQKALDLVAEHQYQQAVKLCRLILLAHPKYVECRLLLAKSLLALARYDDVLVEAQVLLDLESDNAEVYSVKGEAHFFKGEFVAAHAALRRAVALNPSDRKVQRLLADIEPSMDTGGADSSLEEDPAATRSYPLAEQATDIDPTEMMESPPVIEPWDEDDELVDGSGVSETGGGSAAQRADGELMQEDPDGALEAETVARHEVAPALLAASRRPDGSDRSDSPRAPRSTDKNIEGVAVDGSVSFLDETERGGRDSVTRPEVRGQHMVQGPEAETIPALGPKLKARPVVVEGVEQETPVEEGPRGAVVKFLPSDQLVTVEQVGITTGEIKPTQAEPVVDFGDTAPVESPSSEVGTVSLKVKSPSMEAGGGRASKPSVEVGDSALLAKPMRVRPLARHRGRLPTPGGASHREDDLDEMEDAPTTPHLDISGVRPVPLSGMPTDRHVPRQSQSASRKPPGAAELDLGLDRAAPGRHFLQPPGAPPLPSPPRKPVRGGGSPSSPDGVARPTAAQRAGLAGGPVDGGASQAPGDVIQPFAAVGHPSSPRGVSPGGPVGPTARSSGAGSGPAGVHRPEMPPPWAPGALVQGKGVGVRFGESSPDSSSRSRQVERHRDGSAAAVAGSRVGPGAKSARQRGAAEVGRRPGTGRTARNRIATRRTSAASRLNAPWWRRRSFRVGGAVTGVVFLAAMAGWSYVRWKRSGQAATKRARALARMARADPESLLAAQFLFARIQKLGGDSLEARGGRAIVKLILTMEYGDSPAVVQQLVGHDFHASGPLAMASRAGLFLVRGEVTRALEAAGRAAAKHPESSWVFYFKAAAQDAAGDFDGAVGGAKRSLSLSPSSGVAGRLLLARIWRDDGMAFFRPSALKKALEIIEELRSHEKSRQNPAVLLAEAQTRLAMCEIGTGCPCSDLKPVVEMIDKLQLSVRNNPLSTEFLPRVALVRAALLSCLRHSTSAGLALPDLSKGNPGRPDLDALYASVLIELRRTEQASAFLQRSVRRYPGWTRFSLMFARTALARQDLARAGKVLAAVPKDVRSSAWYDLSIRLALAQGKVDEALSLARQAAREYSDRVDVRLAQVDALLAAGKTARAGALAEDLFSHHPNDTRVLVTSAAILARRGEFFRAKARLDSALGRDPNNAVIRLHLGRVLMGLGKYDEARRHVARAVANQPDLAAGWLALGQLDERQGRFSSAVEHYRKLLKRSPGNRQGMYAMAEALIHMGRLDDAAKVLAQVPEGRRRGRWHLLHGWLLLRRGTNLTKAAAELGKASRSDLRGRALAMTFVRRAEAFLFLDQPAQAEQVLGDLDGRQRRLAEVKELWGRIWLWRGKPNRAVEWFKRAVNACSGCPLWYKARLLAYLGRAYYLRGRLRLAWRKFRRAFRLAGTDPMVSFLHGVCVYEEEREDLALRRFKAAVSRDPALMEAYYYMGEIARSAGQKHEAAALFRKFLRARHFGALADGARTALADVTR